MKGNVIKKILIATTVIIFSLVLFSFTIISNAEEEVTKVGTWDISADDGASNVTATLYSDGRFVISGKGNMRDYSEIRNRPYDMKISSIKSVEIQSGVTSIGKNAFRESGSMKVAIRATLVGEIEGEDAGYSCTRFSRIEIPSTVTSIGDWAFSRCTSLSSIEIPSSVTSIGSNAFYRCTSLSSINVDINNKNYISENGVLFNKEKTELIQYPAGKENIEYTIPSSVTSIGDWAFRDCTSLSRINVAINNKNYSSEDGVLFNKEKTQLIKHPAGKENTEYVIPSSVTSIGYGAFRECKSLSSIEIPEGVTNIGDYVFDRCKSLSSIEIPNGVTSIGEDTFSCCTSLSSIKIPEGVTSIGSNAFYKCTSLSSIEIPEGVTSIGDWAFYKCTSLSSIEIPSSVTSIGSNAFYYCTSLSSIKIPEGVTSIGNSAFYECRSLSSIEIPNSVTSIGDYAFYYCTSLSSIKIPEGVTSIGSWAFGHCENLSSIEIPSSVTSIGKYAFSYCTSLSSIEIPEGVTSIGNSAFSDCTSLSSIEIPSSVTSVGDRVFYEAKLTLAVATGTENVQEMELPEIIKRAMNKEDILYTEKDFELTNCTLSEDKTKLVVDTEVASKKTVSLEVTEGALEGLVVVPSGTITYNTTSWTSEDVIATIYVANGETIQNNDGKNTYTFTKNGTFTFEYLTAEGEKKKVTATVNNIDKLKLRVDIKKHETTEENKIKYIENINPNTKIQELIANIETNGKIEIYKGNRKITGVNSKIQTGMTIKITFRDTEISYTSVVRGDLNGDGDIGDIDLLRLVRYQAGLDKNLNGAYLKAADIYKDGNYADNKDLLKIARALAGLENL